MSLGWEQWAALGVNPCIFASGWGWKVTRPSGRGFEGDDADYAAARRDRRLIPLEEAPGVPLRKRARPWHKAAPYSSGPQHLPPVPELPFALWTVEIVAGDGDERGNRTWFQEISRQVPAWWALGPHGRTVAGLSARLQSASWADILTMRRAYDLAWPTEREDPAWYEARDLAQSTDRAFLKNALIRHAETALSSAARTAGKKIRSYSDEQKTVAFAGTALAIADIDPGLAHRLLGPLRLALGDPYAYPVPSWADHP